LFGSAKLAAVVESSEVLRCRTVSTIPGIVNVSVVTEGVILGESSNILQFEFVPDVSVDKISPEFGYTSGGAPIFVFGSNFLNTSALGCAFADMYSRGIFISSTAMICLSPSPLGRKALYNYQQVYVEVSLNGFDYSESKVPFAYSEPCDSGFFCPGMTRQLCPNGTYCPVNSRNFTLCSPGYFQPREGQAECAICPVSYFVDEKYIFIETQLFRLGTFALIWECQDQLFVRYIKLLTHVLLCL